MKSEKPKRWRSETARMEKDRRAELRAHARKQLDDLREEVSNMTVADCDLSQEPRRPSGWVEALPAQPMKFDAGKVPMALLPSEALIEIARVLDYGQQKYAAHNWRQPPGYAWSRLYSALQRHLSAWNAGEDLDPESGLPHLAHAGCQILFLLTHEATRLGLDDRFKANPDSKGCTP
jgi:hypothetical protein